MLKWEIFADGPGSQPLYAGVLPAQQLQDTGGHKGQAKARSQLSGIALSPLIAREAQRFLSRAGALGSGDAAEFTVPAAELTLFPAPGNSEADQQDAIFTCRLELQLCGDEPIESGQDAAGSIWFQWKIARASSYRMRGNEAFKQSRLRAARRLYSKALAWLECPNECVFDEEELALVSPLQTACYVNLATCLWKLGKMEACIAQCSNALKLDEGHVKARYRRGQAYLVTKEFDLALSDLAATLELEPGNRLFASSLERARAAKQKFHRKQREAFGRLFPQ